MRVWERILIITWGAEWRGVDLSVYRDTGCCPGPGLLAGWIQIQASRLAGSGPLSAPGSASGLAWTRLCYRWRSILCLHARRLRTDSPLPRLRDDTRRDGLDISGVKVPLRQGNTQVEGKELDFHLPALGDHDSMVLHLFPFNFHSLKLSLNCSFSARGYC